MSRFFIYRPVFTMMLVLITLVLGAVCISRLPIDLVPDVSFPSLSISTTYDGAGPEEIEELITRPIEEAAGSVPGVEEISSESREGVSQVRLSFEYGTDLSEAANDVRERIDRLINQLPDDADRPRLLKFDLASFPIVFLGVESELDPVQTRLLIDTDIKNRLERVPGVASVDALGGLVREVHVDLDIDKIQALALPFNQVINSLQAANLQVPAGTLEQGSRQLLLRTPEEFKSIDDIRNTIVAQRNGIPVFLGQIAEVKDTYQRITSLIRLNGKPGIRLGIRKQSGTNTVQVAEAVIKEIEKVNQDLPQIYLSTLVDTSVFIKRSLQNVAMAVFFGGLLSVVVLFVFLGNFRTTFVIATAIPVSIVTTFILMYFVGFTLNVITLGGLALGVGMLVDNAIVVLENIFRNREQGEEPLPAAVKGSQQVTAAIIASTLTTMAVFLPLVFVRGISGVTYQRLGVIVAFSLMASLVMALTFVPMLTGRLLGGRKPMTIKARRPFLQWLDRVYRQLLQRVLKAKIVVLPVVLGVFAAAIWLGLGIPFEFMPESDEGEVRISVEMEVGTRLEVLANRMLEVEAAVKEAVPEATDIMVEMGGTGFGGPDASYKAQIRIYLPPLSERNRTTFQIANDLRAPLSNLPGMVIRSRAASGFFVLSRLSGGGSNERVQVDIRGFDQATAESLAAQVQALTKDIRGITDTQLSRDSGTPESSIVVDRVKAADLGLSVSDIGRTLQTVLTGSIASTLRDNGKEFNIRVKIADAEETELERLLQIPVINSSGNPVLLANVVRVEKGTGPVSIERKDQERVLTVRANVAERPLSEVLEEVQQAIREISVPQGFSIVLAGDIEEQQKSFRDLLIGLLLSLLLVYMIMAAQYESYLYPFVVMFSVPLAGIGVVAALLLTNTVFSLQAFIGCIMLGGIVVNNAIILVDQINQLRREDGMPLRAAIEEAGFRRLRPILMTTLTTALGLMPLALGLGEGSEAQAPMARVVIGGLISSTFLTLFVVPVIYEILESLRQRFWPGSEPEAAPSAPVTSEQLHV